MARSSFMGNLALVIINLYSVYFDCDMLISSYFLGFFVVLVIFYDVVVAQE